MTNSPPSNPSLPIEHNGTVPVRGLAAELGKVRPFEKPEVEAWLNVIRTSAAFQAEEAVLFKSFGTTASQYNALRILRGHAERNVDDPTHPATLPVQGIAAEMVTREPDITRLIDRLEKLGYAERLRCSEDRRRVLVGITSAGIGLIDRVEPPLAELIEGRLSHLTAEQLQQLNDLLFASRHGGGATES